MKSPRILGQMLAVCLPGLAGLFAISGQSSAPLASQFSTEVTAEHVEFAGDANSVYSQPMEEIRLVIQQGLQAEPVDISAYLHDALTQLYGKSLSEASAMTYHMTWVDGKPVVVCDGEDTFEISFGARGTILVVARHSMQVPR